MSGRAVLAALAGVALGLVVLAACSCPVGASSAPIEPGVFRFVSAFPSSASVDPSYTITIDEARSTVTETYVQDGSEHRVAYRVGDIIEAY